MALDITTARADVAKLYIAAFDRVPDSAGLDFWVNSYMAGRDTLSSIAQKFTTSTEYTTAYPSYLTTAEYVERIYVNVFNRASDADGKAFWVDAITTGKLTNGTLMKAMVDAAGTNGSNDGLMLANQASFGVWAAVNQVPFATANAQLSSITSVESTLTAAQAAVSSSAGVAGSTFTLTVAADTITGTANNDTFSATYDGAATGTFNVADTIAGGAGNDTLNIVATDDAVVSLPAATTSGVETINIRNVDGDATAQILTVSAANFVGATAVNSDRSTDSVTVTNLASGASAGVIGNGTITNGASSFDYVATAAAATLNIMNGTTAGAIVLGAGTGAFTTATINSTGAANTVGGITVNGASATTLTVNAATNLTTGGITDTDGSIITVNVAGAATSVNLGTLTAAVKTLDASAMTAGGVTATLDAAITSFKGGAGADTVTTTAITSTTAGIIDGGAGTDILVIGATTDLDTAAEAAKYVNFETLRTAGAQDMSLLAGITAVQIGAAGAITQLNATQAAAVKVMSNAALVATSFALADSAGTSDVLSLTLGTGTTTTVASGFAAGLTLNGFETLNLTTNAGPTATAGANQTSTISAFTADKVTTINLYGQSFDLQNAATTKATTINATTLTGNGTTGLKLAGTLVAGSTVNASGVADDITLGTVGSTYNLNAGNDAISGTLAQYRTATTYNTIDGGAGTDTATISGGAALTMVDDDFKGMTNIEKVTVATTTGNDQSITTGGWFDANFKAAGATFTTTTTTGAVSIAAGSFTGNLTVSATTGAVAGSNSITTGTGNDTVTLTNTSVIGTNSISTGAGNDTITGSAAVDTITGGTGADTMTGGTGADVFVFGSNGSVAGTSMDIITDFASGSDVLSFTTATLLAADATALVAGSNVQQSTGGLITFAAADNTLALKIAAIQADTQLDAADSVAIFVDGANTYVYYAVPA